MGEAQLPTHSSLRQRTRDAVRADITTAAVGLFLERGYDATTIDDIAGAVGMSPRSVFRYFPTKEDIVVGKFAAGAERMLEVLRARPAEEQPWLSLRRMFDVVDTAREPDIHALQQMIFGVPALLSVYLRTLHVTQARVADILIQRAAAAGQPYERDDPSPRALAAAAFGCLLAVQESQLDSEQDAELERLLDRTMNFVIPPIEP
ncbi:TetR/AcrR family transcriptional regulator [Aeromicrobium sp. CTD01-1L150]|uniref:TetR/AcrR family transcriptional regulator n=1 Tax=Aeromicrobium sp. CTD01-1L150 TaxID=3341830 RepID=UPI0035BEC002